MEDLPDDPVSEPLAIEDPAALLGLLEILAVDRPMTPLRDATCRSFPVWALEAEATRVLGDLAGERADDVADRWHEAHGARVDADPYELACCLGELQSAITGATSGGALFVLLEERAW